MFLYKDTAYEICAAEVLYSLVFVDYLLLDIAFMDNLCAVLNFVNNISNGIRNTVKYYKKLIIFFNSYIDLRGKIAKRY